MRCFSFYRLVTGDRLGLTGGIQMIDMVFSAVFVVIVLIIAWHCGEQINERDRH